jgi:hypothetical protein
MFYFIFQKLFLFLSLFLSSIIPVYQILNHFFDILKFFSNLSSKEFYWILDDFELLIEVSGHDDEIGVKDLNEMIESIDVVAHLVHFISLNVLVMLSPTIVSVGFLLDLGTKETIHNNLRINLIDNLHRIDEELHESTGKLQLFVFYLPVRRSKGV